MNFSTNRRIMAGVIAAALIDPAADLRRFVSRGFAAQGACLSGPLAAGEQ